MMCIFCFYCFVDVDVCLCIFDSNVFGYFGVYECVGFVVYLQYLDCMGDYWVIECDGWIVVCVGLVIDGIIVVFCWGMVEYGFYCQGFGYMLVQVCLGLVCVVGVQCVIFSISQYMCGFYVVLGFIVIWVVINGYGLGLDVVEMEQVLFG